MTQQIDIQSKSNSKNKKRHKSGIEYFQPYSTWIKNQGRKVNIVEQALKGFFFQADPGLVNSREYLTSFLYEPSFIQGDSFILATCSAVTMTQQTAF